MDGRRDSQPQPSQPPSKESGSPVVGNLTGEMGMNGVLGGPLSLTAQAVEGGLSLSVVTTWYDTIARRQDI